MDVRIERLTSPAGEILLATNFEHQLVTLEFAEKERQFGHYLNALGYRGANRRADRAQTGNRRLVEAYFEGDVRALDSIEIAVGGTKFRQEAVRRMRAIPAGRTSTYKRLAIELGGPARARAVARVAATNPLTLVVPCHRLIGSAGDLRGYGTGLERKRWLLEHELRFAGPPPSPVRA